MSKFECGFCSAVYKQKATLEVHICRIHTLEKPYRCDICGERFFDYRSRRQHQKTKHGEKKKSDLPRRCKIYKKWVVNKGRLQAHHRNMPSENARVKCSKCSNSLKNRQSLLQHQKYFCVNGARQPRQSCVFCEKTFSTEGNLFSHVRGHLQEKPYACPDNCGYSSTFSSNVTRHWRAIHGRSYKCVHCGKSFPQKKLLSKHLELHTGGHPCRICGRIWASRSALERHVTRSHSANPPFPCSKKIKTKGDTNQHVKLSHKKKMPFKCSICSKSFYKKDHLNAHSAAVHKKNVRYSCLFCGKSEGYRSDLDRHIRAHLKENAYFCYYCGDEFSRAFLLKGHLNKVHTTVAEENPIDALTEDAFELE